MSQEGRPAPHLVVGDMNCHLGQEYGGRATAPGRRKEILAACGRLGLGARRAAGEYQAPDHALVRTGMKASITYEASGRRFGVPDSDHEVLRVTVEVQSLKSG